MNTNAFHFMFVPSEPLQEGTELQKMFDLLYKVAGRKNRLNLLRSQTLDNRSALAFAVAHPNCTSDIIEKLSNGMKPYQLLSAFEFAAKRRKPRTKGNFPFCKSANRWMSL